MPCCKDIFIPKLLYSANFRRLLSFSEVFRSGASSDADVRGDGEDAEGWYAAGDGEEAEDDDTRTRRGRTGTE